MTSGFFRDVELPSHAMDHRAHERFQLDTYADRRAEADSSPSPRTWIRAMLARAKLAP